MFPDLISKVYETREKKIKRTLCYTIRASDIGDDCIRRIVYSILNGEDAALTDIHLQLIFDQGALHEKEMIQNLQEAGFQIVEQQTPLIWREHNITGHIDCKVVCPPEDKPIECKTMSEHIFKSIFPKPGVYEWKDVADHFQSKPWLRKYFAQITIYMLLEGVSGGILLFKNKSTGALAQVNVELDYEYGESLLKRAELINRHLKDGTYPDRIPYDEEVCPKCSYFHLCLPDHVGKDPLLFLEDAEIEKLLESRDLLEVAGKDFDRVDKRFKAWAKARPERKICIGKWLIRKEITPYRTMIQVDKVNENSNRM